MIRNKDTSSRRLGPRSESRPSGCAGSSWTKAVGGILAVGILLWCSSCGAPSKRLFTVTSHPVGATIYVDGEPRGQTDEEKLLIDFSADQLVTLRLEKAGFQPTGIVLSNMSPQKIAFFLEESPDNQKILEVLENIRDSLNQISRQLR